jgi:hypothetical protein
MLMDHAHGLQTPVSAVSEVNFDLADGKPLKSLAPILGSYWIKEVGPARCRAEQARLSVEFSTPLEW